MGPSTQGVLLREKDQEITRLRQSVNAHALRTSLTQARLLATQNALDAMQVAHAEELKAQKLVQKESRQKLLNYYEFVKSCQEDKDELRDAVDSFLKKETLYAFVVQDENNYVWPQSQIHISTLLDPLDSQLPMHGVQDASSEDTELAYAAAMIRSLVEERDLAREAQRHTLKTAKAQLAALEAELAHRDLALEKCVSHCSDCPNFLGSSKVRADLDSPLDSATVAKVLQMTSSRHKILEKGNRQLGRRLEVLKAKTTTTTRSRDNGKRSDAASAEALDDSDITVRMPPSHQVEQASVDGRAAPNLIADMDREIRELARTVEEFGLERDRLKKVVGDRSFVGSDSEKTQTVHSSSSDRHGEPSSGDSNSAPAQPELEAAYEASLQREKALIAENVKLLGMLRQSKTGAAHSGEARFQSPLKPSAQQPPQLLDADEGEVSMELATPLMPTTFLFSEKSSSFTSPNVVDSSDPTPSDVPGPLIFGEALSEPHAKDHPTVNDLDRFAGELALAQEQVAESEKAVNELADLVDDLRRTDLDS